MFRRLVAASAVALLCASFAHSAEKSVRESEAHSLLRSGAAAGTFSSQAECDLETEVRRKKDADERTSGEISYTCRHDRRLVVTFTKNPACPPLPAPQGRVVVCPSGTTGAYTQTLSYSRAPHPTCAVPGEWAPSSPPAGICIPTDSDSDGVPDHADECPTVHAAGGPNGCPATPPANTWTLCAREGARCEFSGSRRVRYGAGTTWIEATFTGGTPCTNAAFGRDPARDVSKQCEIGGSVGPEPEPEPEPAVGTATLRWTPPTANDDGSTLSNFAGYRIHYGRAAGELVETVQVANAGITSYELTELAAGPWFFAVRAYTTTGQGEPSSVVSKIVR